MQPGTRCATCHHSLWNLFAGDVECQITKETKPESVEGRGQHIQHIPGSLQCGDWKGLVGLRDRQG